MSDDLIKRAEAWIAVSEADDYSPQLALHSLVADLLHALLRQQAELEHWRHGTGHAQKTPSGYTEAK